MSSFHQIIPPTPGWDRSQAITSHPTNKIPLSHQVMNFSKRVDPLTHHRNPVRIGEFPERPGQSDCDYLMKTGDCKYGTACRYNHPRNQMYNSSSPLLSSKPLYSRPAPKQHIETYQFVHLNSNNMRKNGMSFGQHQNQQIQIEEFPERAGEPECEYYMKTGQCKYKSACRYHHPRSRVPSSSQSRCALSEKGLPLRPGARLCRNYEQQGMCKYGKICLYDHPEDYSPDIPPVTTQLNSLTHVPPAAANLDPPTADNVNSSWNDGWET